MKFSVCTKWLKLTSKCPRIFDGVICLLNLSIISTLLLFSTSSLIAKIFVPVISGVWIKQVELAAHFDTWTESEPDLNHILDSWLLFDFKETFIFTNRLKFMWVRPDLFRVASPWIFLNHKHSVANIPFNK